jgi:hypothetical protein
VSRSLARTAVLAALTAVLAGGVTAPAFAVTPDAPVAGTQACTDLVNNQTNVETARTAVQTATDNLNTALRANPINDATVAADRIALAQAQSNLNNIVTNVTASLCTGTAVVTTTPVPTTVPEPTSPPVVPAPRVIVLPGVLDRDCADFATQADAQAFFLAHGGSPLRNVDNLDANHNGVACEDHFAPVVVSVPQATTVVTSKTVIATKDDGSVATTSGQQVTDVPSGSASTGAA